MMNTGKNTLNLDGSDEKTAAEKADSFRLEGNESFRVNDFEKAVELYTKSLEAKKTVPALLNRSFSYVKMERFEEALSDSDEALKIEPSNLKGKCRRGIALRELGRYSLALKEFGDCLEVESDSNSFQQLYDLCQSLADQKSFVNMKLQIVGYKGSTKSGSSETKLELIDGLPSPFCPHIKHEAKRFRSLAHLEAYIKEHVKGAFGSIRIEDTVFDDELMKFFCSLDLALLATIYMEFYSVGCSGANFAELFGGRLFRPMGIWFSGMDHVEMDLTTALKSLEAVRNTKNFELSETRFERFYNVVGGASSEQKKCAQLDVDTVLDRLHQPNPDIPAHIRAFPTFFGERFSVPDPVRRGERTLTAVESVTTIRGMSGRTFIIDLDQLSGAGGDGKLAQILQKCTQRFRSAHSPVSYTLQLRIPFPPQSKHLNPVNFATLSELLHRVGPTVLRNGVGEQLTVVVGLDKFEMDQAISGDQNGIQVATVAIQRARAPPNR